MSDATEVQEPVGIPLAWKPDPSEIPAVFANFVAILLTEDEVTLTFAQRTITQDGKQALILPMTKMALPLGVLPRLIDALQGISKKKEAAAPNRPAARKRQR